MVVPNNALDRVFRIAQIPKLDQSIFPTRYYTERFVRVVVYVPNCESVRVLDDIGDPVQNNVDEYGGDISASGML